MDLLGRGMDLLGRGMDLLGRDMDLLGRGMDLHSIFLEKSQHKATTTTIRPWGIFPMKKQHP